MEEKATHLPGFLDVLTPIGECLLNSELLAGSQEDNIETLYGFSVEWANGRRTRQIREGCVPSLVGGMCGPAQRRYTVVVMEAK